MKTQLENIYASASQEIEKALSKKVWLDSGAYLIIEPTEACTIIDVNTGKAIKKGKNKEHHFPIALTPMLSHINMTDF